MVLRKPYAFLIKNFKLIHIILTVLMAVMFNKMRSISEFLGKYIDLGLLEQVPGVVKEQFGVLSFLLPILIIALLITILYLLKLKEKPIKYYLFAILAFIIETVAMIMAYVALNQIQFGNANITFLRIIKDLIDVISYIIIPFGVVALVRAVGFNIKQFNFKKDLIELNISEEDSEEFEVEVEVDTDDIKSKINRKFRFIKYIYLENKPIFFTIAGGIFLAIVGLIISLILGIEKIYKENESFVSNGVEVTVLNSYKTQKSYNGSNIRKDKFYVIVDLKLKNLVNDKVSLPYEYIFIRVDSDTKYSPMDDYIDEFSDLGIRYTSESFLKANEIKNNILVFEIDKKYINNDLRFEYITESKKEQNIFSYTYAKVNLKPNDFSNVKLVKEYKLGDTIEFKDSLIKGTKLKITTVDLKNRYNHEYQETIGEELKTYYKIITPIDTSVYKKTVMRLEAELTENKDLNSKIYKSFFSKFVTIKYEKDGKTITQKAKVYDLTPSNSKYSYIEVVEEVANSKNVTLVFTVRDKKYEYEVISPELTEEAKKEEQENNSKSQKEVKE